MNAGTKVARGDAFVFVHADTLVPVSFGEDIAAAFSDPDVVGGRFDVELDSGALPYRIIGAMISLRSRLSRTGTGDQAIFVRREMFERLGGYEGEDLAFRLETAQFGEDVGVEKPSCHKETFRTGNGVRDGAISRSRCGDARIAAIRASPVRSPFRRRNSSAEITTTSSRP